MSVAVAGGAYQSVSGKFAREAGLHDLIDTRWATVAHGVGKAHIIGRIHSVPIVVGGLHRVSTFYVIEGFKDRVLLGMDFFVSRREADSNVLVLMNIREALQMCHR